MIDLLYLAKNRLAFTRASFAALLENTDWDLVRAFHVIDDGSTDGTAEYLEQTLAAWPKPAGVQAAFLRTSFGSPVKVFNHFIENNSLSPFVAKIDSDTVVCPGYLRVCLRVLEQSPELDCLGLEPFYPLNADPEAARSWEASTHTGGIGVFRRSAFERFRLPPARATYFGFGEWQIRHKIKCGWLNPALPVVLLDHLPFEPWMSLSETYIEKGWERASWGQYVNAKPVGYGLKDNGNRFFGPDLWTWRFPVPAPLRLTIIIPSRTDRLASQALERINGACQVIVADNGLSAALRAQHPGVIFVPVPDPFCFARAVNLAVAQAAPDNDLILLNDDALVEPGFAEAMSVIMVRAKLRGFGAVSPIIHGGVGNPDQRATVQAKKRDEREIRITRQNLCFVCVAIPRVVWNEIGGLDERFTAYGFDDTDANRRIVDAGYRLGVTSGAWVTHGTRTRPESTTYKERFGAGEQVRMAREGAEIFTRKWGPGPRLGGYERGQLKPVRVIPDGGEP